MRERLTNKYNVASLAAVLIFSSCGKIESKGSTGPRNGASNDHMGKQNSNSENSVDQNNTQQNSTELLPPNGEIPAIRAVPGATIAYDFAGTLSRVSASAAVTRMIFQSAELKSAKKVKVQGTLVNLRSSSQKQSIDRDVEVLPNGAIDFTIQNLKPDTVYRLEGVSVTDISQGNGSASAVKVRDPYFLATASDSILAKAKRRLALEALGEAYDWDHNNYDSQKGYARGWGWCDYFYTWSASREFKVRAGYGSTSFFRGYGSLGNATQIPALAEKDSMAGDLIRYEGTWEGTHTFMIIAYDTDTKSLWNVEGNFNSRVMRSQRKISAEWMHGHLSEAQVR